MTELLVKVAPHTKAQGALFVKKLFLCKVKNVMHVQRELRQHSNIRDASSWNWHKDLKN
jgi:hypothetical protein